MEVILLEKVDNVGVLGDKVTVKSGFARNFLIPKGKAVFASAENVAAFEERRAELQKDQADKLSSAQSRSEKLTDVSVVIARKAGGEGKLFGSVGAADIAEAVTQNAGIELARQEVRLPEGPLRTVGEFTVDVHLHADVDTQIKVHVVPEEE
jgi:large subunit ribosomal protein L9